MKNREINSDGSIPAGQSETSQESGDRDQTTKDSQTAAWRSRMVLRLGCQGLLPQDIARETGIPVSTVYRYYWTWFGKRRALIARRNQAVENLVQMWERYRAESGRPSQP